MTQEIINRLKELSDKATEGDWRVETEAETDEEQPEVYVVSDQTVCDATVVATMGRALAIPQERKQADADLIVFLRNNANALLSTLTNLTPSGVERIRAEAFEQAAKVAEEIIAGREEVRVIPAHEENDDGDVWLVPEMTQNVRIMAFGTIPAAIRALALPSEPPSQACPHCDDTGDVHRADGEWLGKCDCGAQPPSQGDVEGRAREMLAILKPVARDIFSDGYDAGFSQSHHGYSYPHFDECWRQRQPAIVKALASKEDGRS